jgi:hypothetical protein
MPRYYFHVRRGHVTVLDREGSELADLVEAAKEAARRALQFEAIGTLKDIQNNGAIIVDDEFSTILEVPFGGSPRILRNEFRRRKESHGKNLRRRKTSGPGTSKSCAIPIDA